MCEALTISHSPSIARDSRDQDYFTALSEAIGWHRDTLMTWSLNWFQRSFVGA